VQVQRVERSGRRVTGVSGRVAEPFTGRLSHRVHVRAKAVVLAAGVCATPVLLQKSENLANASGQVGENLQFHPGVAVMGVFPQPIDPWFGATQGYQSLEFLKERDFKLETLWSPPGVLAVRLPGFGHALKERLHDMRYGTSWDAIGRCHRSLGSVRARRGSMDPRLTWHLHPEDAKKLGDALWVLSELFFAAGATKVLPGAHGVPAEMHSLAEAQVLRQRAWRPTDLAAASTHVFCTTRMHGDPRRGVVDERGRAHDAENLWIVDTGIFPRSPGVNPMFTGMALAHRSAQTLAGEL